MDVNTVNALATDPRLSLPGDSPDAGVRGGTTVRGNAPPPDVLRYERVQETGEDLGGNTPQTSAYLPILEDENTGQIIDLYA